MDNTFFRVQTVRRHFYNQNMLYIKGFYLDEIDGAKIRVYADDVELSCSEEKMLDSAEEDESTKDDEDIEIETNIFAQVPELDNIKKIKIVYQDDNNVKTVLTLTNKTVKMIMDNRCYNIDALEKIGDCFVIRGWVIYKQSFELQLYSKGEQIATNMKLYDRLDVEMAYPELDEKEKVFGFRCEFVCDVERDIQLEIKIDDQQVSTLLDTYSDFSGNKKLLAVVMKSLRTEGIIKTFVSAVKYFCHPIALIKRVSNKFGITAAMKRCLQFVKGIMRKIEEVHLVKAKYAELMKEYPYAMKQLLCLADMDIVKQEKKMKRSGDVKYSVLVPLFNTPVEFLYEMIESVQMQTYENWELCLADGSDENHCYVEEICKKYREKDPRILYKKLDKNYGISGNTNECIKMATGNFIALFDHDDFLHPMVLQKCYDVIKKEKADYVYTDEATFQVKLNNIATYHYKPDYAPDNLRANNYICHFSTFSKELLDKVGWYDSNYDGSQDHDLILRLTENAQCVKHIQGILYFWRSHPGSVAENINSKIYAIDAGKRAVLASLERAGMSGTVESSIAFPSIYRIKYDLTETSKVSIIIPSHKQIANLKRCVESIYSKSTYENYEIIIVKNRTEDEETLEYYNALKEKNNIKILEWNEEFNYSAINNFAVKHAEGKYVLFLSEEIKIITPEWIEELLMYAQREDVAAVGAKLYYSNNTIRHAGIVLGLGENRAAGRTHYKCQKNELGYMGRLFFSQNVSAVSSACMLMNKDVFIKLGGFDEGYTKRYHDVDLCIRAMEKGYLNVFTPYAEAYQIASDSKKKYAKLEKALISEDIVRFKNKWERVLEEGDKYFNKNFSLDYSCFVFAENKLFRK